MKKIFSFILIFSVAKISSAQKDNVSSNFTLQQAVEFAYQHQKDVLNADFDIQIARAKVNETRGIGLPQINSSFDLKDFFAMSFLFPNLKAFNSFAEEGTWSAFDLKLLQYSGTAG